MITAYKYNSKTGIKNKDKHNVVWIEKAVGVVTINNQEYSLSDNNILIIGSSEGHHLKSAKIEGIAVDCNDSDFPESSVDSVCRIMLFYSKRNVLNQVVIPGERANEFAQLFFLILNEHLMNAESSVPVLPLMLHTLMLKIEQFIRENVIIEEDKNTDEEELLNSFLNHLEVEYRDKHKVSEYAQMLNVTPRKLNVTIKKYFGTTAKEMISSKLYVEIARLLQFSSTNIKEIAYRLGYKSPYHLTNFFSKAGGSSPLEYRKSFKKQ